LVQSSFTEQYCSNNVLMLLLFMWFTIFLCPAEDFSVADVISPVHLSPDSIAVSMNISRYGESQLIY